MMDRKHPRTHRPAGAKAGEVGSRRCGSSPGPVRRDGGLRRGKVVPDQRAGRHRASGGWSCRWPLRKPGCAERLHERQGAPSPADRASRRCGSGTTGGPIRAHGRAGGRMPASAIACHTWASVQSWMGRRWSKSRMAVAVRCRSKVASCARDGLSCARSTVTTGVASVQVARLIAERGGEDIGLQRRAAPADARVRGGVREESPRTDRAVASRHAETAWRFEADRGRRRGPSGRARPRSRPRATKRRPARRSDRRAVGRSRRCRANP